MMDEGDLDLLKDVPGFKAILRAVLKSQMKHLVDQLSRHGDEEAMLLTTSISDGSFYHMGSKGAEGFLESRDEIQPQFLSHCMKSMQDNTDLTENAKSVGDRSEDQNSSNTQSETSKSTVSAARQQSRSVASPVSLIRVGEETLTITNVQETAGSKAGLNDSKKKRARGGRKRPSETDISVKPSKRLTIAETDTLTSESLSASYEIGKRIKEMPSDFVKTEGTLSVKDGKPKDADSSDTLPPSFKSSVSSEAKNKSDGTAGDPNETEQSLPEFDESREIKVEPVDDDEAADFEESTSQVDFSSGLTTTDGDDKDAPDSKSAKMPDTKKGKSLMCLFQNCSKTFSRQGKLNFHIRNIHLGQVQNTKCELCDKIFSTTNSKKSHVAVVHMGMKQFWCEECDRRFSTMANLESHKRSHHGAKKLQCGTCSATFVYKTAMDSHIRRFHTKQQVRYKCSQCENVYSEKRSLSAHRAAIHDGRTYICDLCGHNFSYKSSYRKHMVRKHSA